MFQFHSGSIKRMVMVTIVFGFPCFNSIVVRLKVLCAAIVREGVKQFQFHSGSIKSVVCGYCSGRC